MHQLSHSIAQNQLNFQRQRLLYPFRESTLAKLREIISELRDNLLTAATTLNIDLATSSLEKLEIIDGRTDNLVSECSLIRQTVTSISRQGNEIVRSECDAMYQRACEWLSAPNPFIDYTRAINEHHPGTGSWFLEDEQFLNWTRSTNSFYWIFGKPGCGKTVLSALIIRHLKECILNAEKALTGFFFFNTNDKPKTKVDKLLRSLTLQIVSQKPGGQKELVDLYRKHLSGQEDPKPAMLVENLAKQISEFKVYLVLDALDECAEARDLMWVIESIHAHGGVRLLCTSRNEEQLKEGLNPLVDYKMDLDNHYLRADLRRYIVERVDSDDELCQWPRNV
ncbi:hypothetical protein CDV55_109120 [Aspergillus turcosus]|uniref:Nephrocystin 3-like N-terminal domain-containing protein n=1 Tax=Aspergillus turcosus TaxID=1245748 RepID=A0A229X6L3_9EURO|nr:hypothetical protein CDV55_109120 [Aspergillus turcosus]RLM01360.1 hypothetical protein CFD26_108965 [Aspergillus turcosus]